MLGDSPGSFLAKKQPVILGQRLADHRIVWRNDSMNRLDGCDRYYPRKKKKNDSGFSLGMKTKEKGETEESESHTEVKEA